MSDSNQEAFYILVVDDNSMQRTLVEGMAIDRGFKVDTAENGMIGVEKSKENQYDAILMDKDMPVLGGIAAVEKIKTIGKNTSTPIIAMTSSDDYHTMRQFREVGVSVMLRKPFVSRELFISIGSAVRGMQTDLQLIGARVDLDAVAPVDVGVLFDVCGSSDPVEVKEWVALFRREFQLADAHLVQAFKLKSSLDIAMIAKNMGAMAGHIGAFRLCSICKELARVNDYRSWSLRKDLHKQLRKESELVSDTLSSLVGKSAA